MKIFPLITAAAVTGVLYLLVMERDRLFAWTAGATADATDTADVATPDAPPADPVTAAAPALVSVVAVHSTAQALDNAVVLRGRTEAARQVEVRAETQGLVLSEPLRKGTTIAAGDVLCTLDPGIRATQRDEALARLSEARARLPEAQAQVPAAEAGVLSARARVAEGQARLAEAQARLAEAEINQTAATRLSEGGFASETRVVGADAALESARAGVSSATAALQGVEAEIIRAEAAVQGAVAAIEGVLAGIQSAEAGVAAVEADIARLTIRAPFGGMLETDTAELGSLLSPGAPCATVIALDPIKVVAFVAEADVARIEPGALAGARLASGQEVVGAVTFLARAADEQTRTFRVEIAVANTDLSIRQGETADILIQTAGQMAHLVPQSALTLDNDGRLGLQTLGEGNMAAFMPVTFLRDTVDGVWVTGLPEQVDIITVGQEYVLDGVAVTPTFAEAAG